MCIIILDTGWSFELKKNKQTFLSLYDIFAHICRLFFKNNVMRWLMPLDASAGLLDWQELSLDACALLSWLFHVYSHIWRQNNGVRTATRSKAVRAHLRQCSSSSTLFKTPGVPSVWKHQRRLAGLRHLIHGEYRCRLFTCVLPAEIMLQVDAGICFRVKTWGRSQKSSPSQPENLQAVKDKALNCLVFRSRMSMCFVTFRGLNLHWEHRQDVSTCGHTGARSGDGKCLIHQMFPGTFPSFCWMFLAANLAVHSRVAIFAYVPSTQAAETDSPPPSENVVQCVLFSSRGRCSDHKSNTETS